MLFKLTSVSILLAAMPVAFARPPPPSGGDGGSNGGGNNGVGGNNGGGGGNNGGGGGNNGGGGGNNGGGAVTPPPPPDDLLIRFSKIVFPLDIDNDLSNSVLPLGPEDYPIRGELANTLKFDSIAHSVMTSNDFEVNKVDLSSYIRAIGGYPSFPSSDSSADFWDEFMEVLEIQEDRRSGTVSTGDLMVLPNIWIGMTLDDVAEAVHDEYPASHHVELIKKLFGQGLQIDYTILPFRSQRDFIGLEVRMADMMTWAVAAVAPTNFLMKWSVGRPRPEEIAMQIENNIITEADGVPGDVVIAVKAMSLTRAEDFTHYDEGCPLHPSWPAMHSASSAASLWLAVVADLTFDQYCQVLLTDYAVSFARTVAGVHYKTDNIAGLNLGQKILADKLAAHLAEKYGADPQAVQQKIDSLTFDWNTFNPVTCTMDNN
jgi:hypothetical protein